MVFSLILYLNKTLYLGHLIKQMEKNKIPLIYSVFHTFDHNTISIILVLDIIMIIQLIYIYDNILEIFVTLYVCMYIYISILNISSS